MHLLCLLTEISKRCKSHRVRRAVRRTSNAGGTLCVFRRSRGFGFSSDAEPVVLGMGIAFRCYWSPSSLAGDQWSRVVLLPEILVHTPLARLAGLRNAVRWASVLRFCGDVDRVCAVVQLAGGRACSISQKTNANQGCCNRFCKLNSNRRESKRKWPLR